MSLIERGKTLAVALDCAPGRLTARILDAKAGRIVGEVEYVPADQLAGTVDDITDIERYDGKLTLWAPFADLHDVPPDDGYSAVVAESEYIALHDQRAEAVSELVALLRLCGPAVDPNEWHRVMAKYDPEYSESERGQ